MGTAPAAARSPKAHGNDTELGAQPGRGTLWDSATTRPCLGVSSIASSPVSPSRPCCDSLCSCWWGSCPCVCCRWERSPPVWRWRRASQLRLLGTGLHTSCPSGKYALPRLDSTGTGTGSRQLH